MKNYNNPLYLQKIIQLYHFEEIFPTIRKMPVQLFSYEADEIILAEGQPIDALLYLVEGKIKATASVGNGKSLLLRFNQPLSIVGDIEWIRRIDVQSQITAVTDCIFLAVPFEHLYQHEMKNALFLQDLLQQVTYKLQTNTTASRVNLLASVDQRFASYLLSVKSTENRFGVEMHTENSSEIADLLGTTQRHLNRVIKKLMEQGIIEKQQRKIRILDEAALEQLAQGMRYE